MAKFLVTYGHIFFGDPRRPPAAASSRTGPVSARSSTPTLCSSSSNSRSRGGNIRGGNARPELRPLVVGRSLENSMSVLFPNFVLGRCHTVCWSRQPSPSTTTTPFDARILQARP